MLLYYRLPGFVAIFALSLQIIGQILALSIPQFTLTLPGIAAIILSIGMVLTQM
jgi:preprotein translocase subunit SecD